MAKTVIVKISDGLGNQMFQYAFGLSLEKKCNAKVYFDTSFFDEDKKRNYELGNFRLKLKNTNNWWLRLCKFLRCKKVKEIKEKKDSIYFEDFYNVKSYNLYIGYFQTYKYFDNYRNDILKAFELKTPLNEENEKMLKKIKSSNSVSLHVRRTDYLYKEELKIRGVCDLDYYGKAIKYIEKNIKAPHFFVFSDDIAWCLEHLKFQSKYTFVDINDAQSGYFDMFLMKNCKHNIIANSSFSWWGAWLNEHNNKIVIAPKIWMIRWNETEENAGRDLIPSDWIRI